MSILFQKRLVAFLTLATILCVMWEIMYMENQKSLNKQDSFDNLISIMRSLDVIFQPFNTMRRNDAWSSIIKYQGLGLNIHQWKDQCFRDVSSLRKYPMFPNSPTNRKVASRSWIPSSKDGEEITPTCAQRLFGYLITNETGFHEFGLESRFDSEFWISRDNTNPDTLQLIVKSSREDIFKNITKVWLEVGSVYYLEILHIGCKHERVPKLSCKFPSMESSSEIAKEHLSPKNASDLISTLTYDPDIQANPAIFYDHYKEKLLFSNYKDMPYTGKTTYIPHHMVSGVLPECLYEPLYLKKKESRGYQGVTKYFIPTYTNPYPGYEEPNLKEPKNLWLLNDTDVKNIVNEYLQNLEETFPRRFKVQKILNVEVKHDYSRFNWNGANDTQGQRILLELALIDNKTQNTRILSEYIYKPVNTSSLCYPQPMKWNRTVPVYFVVTSKNLGRWLQHFINNIESIYTNTLEKNIGLIIFDYNSSDIDIDKARMRSPLTFFKVIKRTGAYSRTESFNSAVKLVTDPNSIVFLLDLHLYIPPTFVDSIRKHCIQGRSVYTPILVILDCGYFPENPRGMWESYGYGLIGMYKSDWDRVGGMNEMFRKWGGEDWNLIDRVLTAGLEYERLRHPDIYHYYHTKSGMWNKQR